MTHSGETAADDDYKSIYPTAADAVAAIRSRPDATDDGGTKVVYARPKPKFYDDRQLLASYSKCAAEGNGPCAYMAAVLSKKLGIKADAK